MFMLRPFANLPSRLPMFPHPISPRYFPLSSVPLSSFFNHSPFRIPLSPLGICLARENIKPKTSSATAVIAPSTALITRMFFAFAVSSSILSKPTPTLAIILHLSAFSISSFVSFVLLRTMMMLNSPILSLI